MRSLIIRNQGKSSFNVETIDGAQVAQVRALIPQYQAGLVGASQEYIAKSIAALALLYPPPKVSDQEARTRFTLYLELLADIPADALAEALRTVGKNCRFFPTVAEIREAAEEALAQRKAALNTLHSLEWRYRYDNEPFDHRKQALCGVAS